MLFTYLLILIGIIAGVGILQSQPFVWRVYSNTQSFEATIQNPTTGTYNVRANVHSGSNSCVIRQGIGGPTFYFETSADSSREIALTSQYNYHMGTDEGSLPIPGTCTWTLTKADSQPDQQEP